MKTLSLVAFAVLMSNCFIAYPAGFDSTLPKVCYETVNAAQFCTTDNLGKVQVYIYNAGWCPACNSGMSELSSAHVEFANAPVVFASLSGEGFSRGSKPDKVFLQKWKQKHGIPFVVAGKYGDFGTDFQANGAIPFVVIIDKSGNVVQNDNLDTDQILSTVRDLLKKI